MIRRMEIPRDSIAASVAARRPIRNRPFDRTRHEQLQADERLGDLVEPGPTSQWTCRPIGSGAAPSSLLFVIISPSVMTVKRPCASRRRTALAISRRSCCASACREQSGPPVIAGAFTSTAPSDRRRRAMNGMTTSLSGSSREDEILRHPAFEMVVDVEHALSAIGRPIAIPHISSAWLRRLGWTLRRGRASRTLSPFPRFPALLLRSFRSRPFGSAISLSRCRAGPCPPQSAQCAMLAVHGSGWPSNPAASRA